jgi:hypothetical protein
MDSTTINYPHWLTTLDDEAFDAVADAAERVVQIHEALVSDGITLQAELFRDRSNKPITAWEHYPADDCRDPKSGAMFYYHAHEPEEWDRDEHGHFHLFVRRKADGDFTHAMAIAMTPHGLPNALFSTNDWVTAEKMLPATEVLDLLHQRWEINRARPSWLVAQWLSAMVRLLQPMTENLLQRRDQKLTWSVDGKPSGTLLGDRNTHILSELPVDLIEMLQAIQEEAQQRINQNQQQKAYG